MSNTQRRMLIEGLCGRDGCPRPAVTSVCLTFKLNNRYYTTELFLCDGHSIYLTPETIRNVEVEIVGVTVFTRRLAGGEQ